MPRADASPAPAPAARRRLPWRRIGLGLAVLAALVVLGRTAGDQVPRFAAWVDSLGALGPAVFVAGYALAVVVFVPGSLLTLAAGAIFGVVEGTLWVFVAATLGATLAFLLGRHAARGLVERRLAGDRRFAAIDDAIGREGLKIVLLLRLSPVFPYNLLNYALGLTRVRLRHYVLGSVGMLPGTLLYVYSGKLAGDVAAAAGGAEVARGPGYWIVVGLGFAATVAVTVLVTRIARRALREATDARLAADAPDGAEGRDPSDAPQGAS
ncbi:MAG: TVP38/TMEM64 family protein [Myxococcota bacterium]|nr:TVP38/TMEM64 family protein [Myxococcota bacterium]